MATDPEIFCLNAIFDVISSETFQNLENSAKSRLIAYISTRVYIKMPSEESKAAWDERSEKPTPIKPVDLTCRVIHPSDILGPASGYLNVPKKKLLPLPDDSM